MAVVFQEYGRSLFPWMRSARTSSSRCKQKRSGKAGRRELVADALEAVGLADGAGRLPWQLSGGMQQRVPSPARWPTSRTSC